MWRRHRGPGPWPRGRMRSSTGSAVLLATAVAAATSYSIVVDTWREHGGAFVSSGTPAARSCPQVAGRGHRDAVQCRSKRRGLDAKERTKKVAAEEKLAAEVAAEEVRPKTEEEQRVFLGSLWEQWGLLGLLVGLAFAFGFGSMGAGLGDGDSLGTLSGASDALDAMGAMDALGALGATVGGLMGSQETADMATDVATQEGLTSAAESAASAVGGAEALELGSIAGQIGIAGAVGVTSSLAGLVTEGLKSIKIEEAGPAAFLDVSGTTPGTIRQSGRLLKDAGDETQESDAADGDRPGSALRLGLQNFEGEWEQLLEAARSGNRVSRKKIPSFLPMLQLSNEAVMDRENARPEVPTPFPVRVAYDVLCRFIDVVFEDRPIQRFWFLETVARMPYFAYSSVLHLYETLGWWRSPELRAVHAAEEDNELHHLLIMESLGGDQRWLDRFFAQHGAIAYYWILVGFFIIDPRWSYNFSRLIEAHAVDTYGEFRDANEELLKSLPPPPVAIEYYRAEDLYLFDKFQTALAAEGKVRRPPCSTLYDVFANICDDEDQHVATMAACEEWVSGGEAAVPLGFNRLSIQEYEQEVTRTEEGRAAWIKWGEEVAAAAREAGRQVN
eukprot:CAMPEP_0170593022 /NCGR_PEP_ID=MMETSP0224-20130122/13225_1 /TAXON_ID=285029 /ORGANISM="Togula jolla, Strain CCCM 725" /LENGTH=614 /DNA_ID=CAMNT_0010916945 /DNA_START=41 /DNA_END=1885 /DNA_ORIENTATION=+